MILSEILLHDFGLYRGQNSINLLPPDDARPIILFGGLNGAGKTTILDAIQLCLFGPRAQCSNRNGLSYERYLLSCIHDSSGTDAASVEIEFSHMSAGKNQRFRVRRSWRKTRSGCHEHLEVFRDGRIDKLATENWAEQVEEFIPARIAHLFLFDGEKVEAYAEPASSAGLIETAVYNLLGLDLVEKLSADLHVLERRKKIEKAKDIDRIEIEVAELELEELQRLATSQSENVAALNSSIARAKLKLEKNETKFRREGGHLFENRVNLETELSAARQELEQVDNDMREIAAVSAPLLLVRGLLDDVAQQNNAEVAARDAEKIVGVLEERDAVLLDYLAKNKASDPEQLNLLRDFLGKDREDRSVSEVESYLEMPEPASQQLSMLLSTGLNEITGGILELLDNHKTAAQNLEHAELKMAAIPTKDALKTVMDERTALTKNLKVLEVDLSVAQRDLEISYHHVQRKKGAISRLYKEQAQSAQDQDDLERTLRHSARVRSTLEKFGKTMIERHLTRIEDLILDSFQKLLRKQSLVANLRIDADDFTMKLTRPNGETLTPDRLSAGERQLLAISALWGLARASGRPLPTIVDTPLGRLDSTHRELLIEHYFPHASHQVILLSTDEEITGDYLEKMRPYIGREYKLVFDENTGATTVEHGYFDERLVDVH